MNLKVRIGNQQSRDIRIVTPVRDAIQSGFMLVQDSTRKQFLVSREQIIAAQNNKGEWVTIDWTQHL